VQRIFSPSGDGFASAGITQQSGSSALPSR
jgi:hypothetical protein